MKCELLMNDLITDDAIILICKGIHHGDDGIIHTEWLRQISGAELKAALRAEIAEQVRAALEIKPMTNAQLNQAELAEINKWKYGPQR